MKDHAFNLQILTLISGAVISFGFLKSHYHAPRHKRGLSGPLVEESGLRKKVTVAVFLLCAILSIFMERSEDKSVRGIEVSSRALSNTFPELWQAQGAWEFTSGHANSFGEHFEKINEGMSDFLLSKIIRWNEFLLLYLQSSLESRDSHFRKTLKDKITQDLQEFDDQVEAYQSDFYIREAPFSEVVQEKRRFLTGGYWEVVDATFGEQMDLAVSGMTSYLLAANQELFDPAKKNLLEMRSDASENEMELLAALDVMSDAYLDWAQKRKL